MLCRYCNFHSRNSTEEVPNENIERPNVVGLTNMSESEKIPDACFWKYLLFGKEACF